MSRWRSWNQISCCGLLHLFFRLGKLLRLIILMLFSSFLPPCFVFAAPWGEVTTLGCFSRLSRPLRHADIGRTRFWYFHDRLWNSLKSCGWKISYDLCCAGFRGKGLGAAFLFTFSFVNNNLLLEVGKEVKSGVFVKSLFSTLLV